MNEDRHITMPLRCPRCGKHPMIHVHYGGRWDYIFTKDAETNSAYPYECTHDVVIQSVYMDCQCVNGVNRIDCKPEWSFRSFIPPEELAKMVRRWNDRIKGIGDGNVR